MEEIQAKQELDKLNDVLMQFDRRAIRDSMHTESVYRMVFSLDELRQNIQKLGISTVKDTFARVLLREIQEEVEAIEDLVSIMIPYIPGQFGVSSSLLLPLHQVGKLDSWEDFQDRQAMTLFTTRSTAGTTEPMSSAPRANGICSLAISPAPRHGTLSRSSAAA